MFWTLNPRLSSTSKAGLRIVTICREIIERHGGTIELADHDQPGAAFRIRLPG